MTKFQAAELKQVVLVVRKLDVSEQVRVVEKRGIDNDNSVTRNSMKWPKKRSCYMPMFEVLK